MANVSKITISNTNYIKYFFTFAGMKRKPSPKVKCDICEKIVEARGLKSHVRLMHKLKLTEKITITPIVPTQVTTQVITQVKPKLPQKAKPAKDKPCEEVTQVVTQVEKPTQVTTQVATQVTPQVFTEVVNQRIEVQRIYTRPQRTCMMCSKQFPVPGVMQSDFGSFCSPKCATDFSAMCRRK